MPTGGESFQIEELISQAAEKVGELFDSDVQIDHSKVSYVADRYLEHGARYHTSRHPALLAHLVLQNGPCWWEQLDDPDQLLTATCALAVMLALAMSGNEIRRDIIRTHGPVAEGCDSVRAWHRLVSEFGIIAKIKKRIMTVFTSHESATQASDG